MEPAIQVRDVRKQYGDLAALAGVDLDISRGEVFSLLGPNGAGKSTLVEICEGFRQRTSGDVSVLGVDPAKGDGRWRSRIGIVLQTTSVFDELSVEEAVRHFSRFYPAPLSPDHAISLVGLQEQRKQRCGKLSGGQKRRVDLAIGIIGDPELIFLDEPTTGLDPQARRQIWDVVRDFASLGKTVVLTTHYLDEAEQLAERVGVIIRGKLVELGTTATLGGRETAPARVTFRRAGALASANLPGLVGDISEQDGLVTLLTAAPTESVATLAAWASNLGATELPALAISRPTLEDIYLDLIARTEKAGAK